MTTETTPRKRWNWLSFIIGVTSGLVILGAVWIGVGVSIAVKAQQQAEYHACLAAHGFDSNAPMTDQEIDRLAAIAEACSK